MFRKLLIANRGEIAVRVIRACRTLGVKTVAVYSDADADALHVRLADEAVRLGPAPAAESYLDQEKILDACARTGAEAVHPGYGFLAENAGFARRLNGAGVKFVGPSPEAMEQLGDKVAARKAAIAHGVPVSAGSEGALEDAAHAQKVADEVGYPVMLKAAAGGGGIGMRIVRSAEDMEKQYLDARAQAESAFGVPDVFLEKFIERPRHIEVQVLGDEHGHLIHLGERECSIQRRHQKVIEEAPSPALSAEERASIGEKAAHLARVCGYANAGTMEFLYEDGEFYFNEMNTRLQVEHPVTELVTGIDIVAWQIRIAAGERLAIEQDDVQMRGHAIELRVNAEDPAKGFMPSPGRIARWVPPSGPGIRVDSGVRQGWTVPSAYDSMVAKLIAHGSDRDEAVRRVKDALDEMVLEGFPTNLPVHRMILDDETFLKGEMTTRFLEERGILEALESNGPAMDKARLLRVAALAAALDRPRVGGIRILHHRQHAVARRRSVTVASTVSGEEDETSARGTARFEEEVGA